MWWPNFFSLGVINRICGVPSSWSDRRRWRCLSTIVPPLIDYILYIGGWATIPWPRPLFFHVTRLNFHIKSRNLGLPSERVASINMHSIAYLSPQLFRIVQRFPRTARGCVDWVRCSCSTPFRDRISAAPPCCSPDAHSLGILPRHVFAEQRGGAAEILSRNGVEHGQRTQSTHSRVGLGPIFTY